MFEMWAVIIGVLLIAMALAGTFIQRLPLTTTIFYLIIGLLLGPLGIEYITINPLDNVGVLERAAEIAVIVSLFNAGIKLQRSLRERTWFQPVRLAFVSMIITVGLISIAAYFMLSLPVGAAIILGAVLAPTDPVLASDVQVQHPEDPDDLRFTLTGEAGMNDGTVFPFIMLGLGLSGLHEIGESGLRWLLVDVIWAITGGFAVGAGLGVLTGKVLSTLHIKKKESLGRFEFISIGLISLSYGTALLLSTYGFLSVFAAGLMLLRSGNAETGKEKKDKFMDGFKKIPLKLSKSILQFNEQLEHILELAVVIIIGAIITYTYLPVEAFWFVPLIFLLIRPVSVWIGLSGLKVSPLHTVYYSWFGIRGIGSLYYLMYAIRHGLPEDISHKLITFTLIVIVASIFFHGISATPLMNYYNRKQKRIEKSVP